MVTGVPVCFLAWTMLQGAGLQFTPDQAAVGLQYSQNASASFTVGSAVGDVDGDGRLDILLFGGAVGTRVFLSTRDGQFRPAPEWLLPADLPPVITGTFADIDNDGDQDLGLVVTTPGSLTRFLILYKDGDRYRRLLDPGFCEMVTFSGSAGFGDINRDGLLDIVRLGYFGPGFILMQRNGRFTALDGPQSTLRDESWRGIGSFDTFRRHWSAIIADFDGDGWCDVHAAVDQAPDFQARNLGGVAFANVSTSSGVTNVGSDMGTSTADIDGDGDLDIYSTNIEHHVLYVNDGTGQFTDQAARRGVRDNGTPSFEIGWGTQFGDLDNDGDLDLVVVDTGVGMICLNDGNGYFTRDDSNNGALTSGFGLVIFDYDHDGDLDFVTTGRTGLPKLNTNRSPALAGRHWIVLDLVGTASNRDGIGARIHVTTGRRHAMREVIAGESFMSGPPTWAHFGLGAAKSIDRLEIRWPSGLVQVLEDVEGDRYLRVTEGNSSPVEF